MLNEIKIFPTITTTGDPKGWKDKIKEIKKLKIKEACLFLTVLNYKERKNLYRIIGKVNIEKIPFIHLRSDMRTEEIDYLIENYGTEVFNTHTKRHYPFVYDWSKYRKNIFIENVAYPLDEREVSEFAGICLDFAHLENNRILYKETFNNDIELIKKYLVGCSHISAIKKIKRKDRKGPEKHDFHYFDDLSEFDYLEKYPLEFFPPYIALELENSIEEQLKAKKYIYDLLGKKT